MHDTGGLLPRDAAMNRPATAEERKSIESAIEKGLDEGGLGMGMGIVYTPTAGTDEDLEPVLSRFEIQTPGFCAYARLRQRDRVAAGSGLRCGGGGSSTARGSHQQFVYREDAGSATHDRGRACPRPGCDHRSLSFIAGMTDIASGQFNGWENQPPEYFARLMWPPTRERLTRDSFQKYRKQGGFVAQVSNTEEMVKTALASPLVMIASDGILEGDVAHPRAAGTYARVLGKYVREEKVLPLMEAIRKSSLMPAQRLEAMSPQMRRKGRLQVGADADIDVFDPATVIDKSTFDNPKQYSQGFRYVLVGGSFVVREGKLQDVTPGKGIRSR